MTDLNEVVLIGRLTRDVGSDERSFGYLQNGTARANLSMAVNRSRKQGDQWIDEVSYFDVTVFGKAAENLKPYFLKGTQVAIRGYLKQDRWEKDGQKQSKIIIVATDIQITGNRKNNSENNQGSNQQSYQNNQQLNSNYSSGDAGYDSGDIPF